MKTIAEKAGVSVMTVSRALRNDPEVNKETQGRILLLAKQLGYKKHPYISALMSQRGSRRKTKASPVIALVHCLPFERELTHNMKVFQASAHEAAEEQSFELEEFYLHEPGMTLRRLVDILKTRNIRGVVFEHFFTWGNRLNADFSSLACVAIGSTIAEPSFHRVDSDFHNEMRIAMSKIYEYGYRRPCLVNMEGSEQHNHYRRRSAFMYGQLMFAEEDRIPIPMGIHRRVDLKAVIDKWLQKYQPDILLSMQPDVLHFLEEFGLKVPDDIGFVHVGLGPALKGFAGINPNWRQKAITAVNHVVDSLNRNDFGIPENPICMSVEHIWIDGPSMVKRSVKSHNGLIDTEYLASRDSWKEF